MPAELIDTHAHLDDPRFAEDLPAVLDRAAAAGVVRVLTIGIDLATSSAALALTAQYPERLAAVVGIQPNHAAEAAPGDFDEIARLAADPLVVAVGETGLDRYWDRAPFPLQEEYFIRHLALAHRLGKPVVIHCRDAGPDVVRVLWAEFERHGPVRGVMHSFTGDAETARECLDLGLHLSFAGMLTYKTAADLREAARLVPPDRLLVETDSPYLAPVPVRGKRNEPAFVAHTAACLAGLVGLTVEELAAVTTRNARELFGLAGGYSSRSA
jgi:TatD DNase family protein